MTPTSIGGDGRVIWNLARSLIGKRAGAAMLEFAIGLPVFVMLLFGIFEFGRMLWIQNALHYSVQQAARCASINATTCGSTSAIQSYAAGIAGAGIPSSAFTVTLSTACGTITGDKVAASYPLSLNIPYMSLNPTLSAQSCFPK
jgi:Flp pilus assembly protein TadG